MAELFTIENFFTLLVLVLTKVLAVMTITIVIDGILLIRLADRVVAFPRKNRVCEVLAQLKRHLEKGFTAA